MEKRELDKEFKDSDSNFRVVFVCAMWLTGFDVKSLSCLYLDKPLKAHTLMQTIARANRVAAGKSNGLIIDYIGIVGALKKALNDYTANKNGRNAIDPTVNKEELIGQIIKIIRIYLTNAFINKSHNSFVGINILGSDSRFADGQFKAHDELECHEGDTVKIMETRPLSKDVCWRVVEIIERQK